jgi:ketosteroid isomerase-like protein
VKNISTTQNKDKILQLAADLDDDLEKKDINKLLGYFSEDCEIELLGLTLRSHSGVKKWLEWFFRYFESIKFEPIVILVDNDTFFEEFFIHGITLNHKKLSVKVSEVLIYENYKIKSLRLYLDRLMFAEAAITGLLSKKIVNLIKKKSTQYLINQ